MFRFRLEKVLQWRQHCVEEQTRLVQHAAGRLRQIQQQREAIDQQVVSLTRWHARDRQQRVDLQLWNVQAAHLAMLHQRRQEMREQESQAAGQLAVQRSRLMAAHRQQAILQALKERHWESWQEDQRRRERKELDEVGGRATRLRSKTRLPA